MDQKLSKQTFTLALLGMLLLAGIVIVAILRDRIVNTPQWTVSVMGQGKVEYQPDIALINLGIQVDRANTAQEAIDQLDQKMEKVTKTITELGLPKEDIHTQNFSVFSQYDYIDGKTIPAGYNANQQLIVKVKNLSQNPDLVEKIINESSKTGVNQINGVSFDVSNLEELKNQARIKAMEEAKQKADGLALAAGVRLKKVVGWWENFIQGPGAPSNYYYDGKGGMGAGSAVGGSGSVPTGLQEIIIEISLNYQIK